MKRTLLVIALLLAACLPAQRAGHLGLFEAWQAAGGGSALAEVRVNTGRGTALRLRGRVESQQALDALCRRARQGATGELQISLFSREGNIDLPQALYLAGGRDPLTVNSGSQRVSSSRAGRAVQSAQGADGQALGSPALPLA